MLSSQKISYNLFFCLFLEPTSSLWSVVIVFSNNCCCCCCSCFCCLCCCCYCCFMAAINNRLSSLPQTNTRTFINDFSTFRYGWARIFKVFHYHTITSLCISLLMCAINFVQGLPVQLFSCANFVSLFIVLSFCCWIFLFFFAPDWWTWAWKSRLTTSWTGFSYEQTN